MNDQQFIERLVEAFRKGPDPVEILDSLDDLSEEIQNEGEED